MIAFTAYTDVGVRVEQWCVQPTVYLDHWAWRKISDSAPLAEKFLSALKSRGGTLALSWLNLTEFNKVTDDKQACKADDFLDRVLPHAFFLNPNFFRVIDEEDKLQRGGESTAPHADLVTLKFFVKNNLLKSSSLELLPKQNLFRLVRATGITDRFDGFADLIISRVESLRKEYANNRGFCLVVKRVPKGQPIQRGTRFIARELLGSLLKNKNIQVDRNHAIDICHAIVPVTTSNAVLTVTYTPTLALQVSAGYPVLNLYGVLSSNFVVQYSTNLASNNWINLLFVTNLSSNPYLFPDSNGVGQPARFYRAIMQ